MCAMKSVEGSASTGHAVQLMTSTKATTRVVCARSLETPPFAAKAILPATGRQVWKKKPENYSHNAVKFIYYNAYILDSFPF